jgi:uncharacterized protein (TIGR03032 family)
MKKSSPTEKRAGLHDALWRDPAQVAGLWADADRFDAKLLKPKVSGAWWETIASLKITLLITREYEHVVVALAVKDGRPLISYLPLPHPSGLAVNRERGVVHLASTRNPNQVYDLAPVKALMERADVSTEELENQTLIPLRSRFFPGSLYLHDLALINGELYANAVGQNAVVRLADTGAFEPVWWPRCVETEAGPRFDRNLLQLNSIAAGSSIKSSYFSASVDKISGRRPGHRNFPVDGRGVIFSGRTGEAVARGLTRPHSARLLDETLWVDNSGYGEFGRIEGDRFEALRRLPGWTRGLCFKGRTGFVGTSRVIPRFRQYAPGLDVEKSVCGVHAVDTESGEVLGSILWPEGNQIFAVEWITESEAVSLPFIYGRGRSNLRRAKLMFYAYQPPRV